MSSGVRIFRHATLVDFEEELASIIGKPAHGLRPFVCEGSPLDCEVFIIGSNAATRMPNDFWEFWDPVKGFNKRAWQAAYSSHRQNEGEARSSSNTRDNIDSLVKKLKHTQVLETNTYAKATKRQRALSTKDRVTDPIDFLIESIQPRLIVAHGKPAATHLQDKDIKAHVIAIPHLALGWFEAAIHSLAQQIRCKLDA